VVFSAASTRNVTVKFEPGFSCHGTGPAAIGPIRAPAFASKTAQSNLSLGRVQPAAACVSESTGAGRRPVDCSESALRGST
jgi:hypothetical protein